MKTPCRNCSAPIIPNLRAAHDILSTMLLEGGVVSQRRLATIEANCDACDYELAIGIEISVKERRSFFPEA